ncbi:MAG: peroxiredoxin [Nanoarchaeota archaeon]
MENQKASDFTLKDKTGKMHKLSDIKSKYTIVYFYPKDDTSGCTIEAVQFTGLLNNFKKNDIEIIGVSGGNDESKKKFCDKHNIKITLLSDSDFTIAKKYKVYGEKSFLGKKFLGIKRTTFVLDKNRNIIKTYNNVSPNGHAKEVLEFIKSLS